MRRTSFRKWPCSIARTMDMLGDWWTPLVLREIFFGTVRFDDLQRGLSIGRNVLTERLQRLTAEGLLERRRYCDAPPRYEYHLTEKGRDFYPVLLALMRWGDRWLHGKQGPPILVRHSSCGALTQGELHCTECDQPLRHEDTSAELPDGRTPDLELRVAALRRVRASAARKADARAK